jgi:hypothetical protein
VTKKKDSVALFEVISKSRQKRGDSDLGVPGWIEPPEAPRQQAEKPSVPARQAAAIPQAPSRPVEPAIGVVGGRLTVSLNYVSCMVIAMGLLVLLLAAFWLGRATGGAAKGEPTEAGVAGFTEGQSTGGSITEGGTRPPPSTGHQKATDVTRSAEFHLPVTRVPKRVSGKYYLVIESIKKNTDAATQKTNREEADRIIEFCKQKGEPSELRSMKGRFIVWSLTPHDSSESEAALRHARFIQDNLGKEYFEKYKTYKFLHTKNGKFTPWYIRQP